MPVCPAALCTLSIVCLISSNFFPVGAVSSASFFLVTAKIVPSSLDVEELDVVNVGDDVNVLDEVAVFSVSSYCRSNFSVSFSKE